MWAHDGRHSALWCYPGCTVSIGLFVDFKRSDNINFMVLDGADVVVPPSSG